MPAPRGMPDCMAKPDESLPPRPRAPGDSHFHRERDLSLPWGRFANCVFVHIRNNSNRLSVIHGEAA
jgi:hypothetical protein